MSFANLRLADTNDDYVGLWQIVSRVSKQDKSPSEEEIRAQALKALRSLLKNGLVIGDLKADGGFEQWPVQDTEAVISQVEMKWNELGHAPDIGDICWLNKI